MSALPFLLWKTESTRGGLRGKAKPGPGLLSLFSLGGGGHSILCCLSSKRRGEDIPLSSSAPQHCRQPLPSPEAGAAWPASNYLCCLTTCLSAGPLFLSLRLDLGIPVCASWVLLHGSSWWLLSGRCQCEGRPSFLSGWPSLGEAGRGVGQSRECWG